MTRGATRVSRAISLLGSISAFALVAFLIAVPARADRLYWTNFDGPEPLTYADLGGGAVSQLSIAPLVSSVPNGVAIDPAGGRVYFANSTKDEIDYANLDGSGGGTLNTVGATVGLPIGVAIDPDARRIYWANANAKKISYAKLDGSGGGDLNTSGATVDQATAIAVDPAEGRVYWTNGTDPGSIAYAALDGSGGADLPISGGATLVYPLGLAIDQAAKKIYWTNDNNEGPISFANLDGGGSRDLSTTGTKIANPYGLALDPEAGRVYWGNTANGTIGSARTDGSGGATVPLAIPAGSAPNFPVIYKSPRVTEAPLLSIVPPPAPKAKRKRHGPAGPPKLIGSRISCAPGRFAPDLVEAFLYQAPVTRTSSLSRDGQTAQVFEEERRGTAAAGAVMPPVLPRRLSYTADAPGVYRCLATGTNDAGSTVASSEGVAIFAAGRAKPNEARGTARLALRLPAEKGALTLRARGLATVSRQAFGSTFLRIRPKGRAKARLARSGKLDRVLKIAYDPPDAPAATLRVPITLRHR